MSVSCFFFYTRVVLKINEGLGLPCLRGNMSNYLSRSACRDIWIMLDPTRYNNIKIDTDVKGFEFKPLS